MIIIKVDKQQLMDILGVQKEGLKTIEKRQQLYIRLEDKGYEFIDKVKEGRKMYYIIEKQSDFDFINCDTEQVKRRLKYDNLKCFNVELFKRNNIGIYYILKDNDIYIGSTITGFRKRCIRHYKGQDKNMQHTYDLLKNGATFNILYDMTGLKDKLLIKMVEQEFINYFINYTYYNVINKIEKTWSNKIKYKTLKIEESEYEQAIQLLKDNGLLKTE